MIEKSRNGDEESDVLTGVQLFSSSDQYHSWNKGQLAISHWRPASDYWRCSEQNQREESEKLSYKPKNNQTNFGVKWKVWTVVLHSVNDNRPSYWLQQISFMKKKKIYTHTQIISTFGGRFLKVFESHLCSPRLYLWIIQ